MIDIEEFLLSFSIFSLILYFLRRLRKTICMALTSPSKPSSSSPPSAWFSSFFVENPASSKRFGNYSKRKVSFPHEYTQEKQSRQEGQNQIVQENKKIHEACKEDLFIKENGGLMTGEGSVERQARNPCEIKQSVMSRKRPTQLILPANCHGSDFAQVGNKLERKEFLMEGKGFSLASKKGRREIMEDGHGIMLDISGNPKQAFFVVTDGHGGRAAAEFVAENLGRNILNELNLVGNQTEAAILRGYSVTDDQFLNQGVNGGACAASVLLKDGELHVANVGDCRVVMNRKGMADALTRDHRLSREDERARIENSGGYLDCRNGVWRVNGSLAVSRAFGDFYLKDHVISEPEILKLPLTSDCEFLIMASDGLWDKVGEQEAVDVVSRRMDSLLEACKELVDMSSSRGNLDDATVMVINLQNFVNGQLV